jgi:FlaG/FlaF family flagellin (archaellin)
VVLAVAAAVIMVGVVVVAVGRGGEMAYFPSDYAPLELGVVAATDVVLLRPPTSIWGYNMQVTDEALNRITQALSQRDVRIASLEQQVADLRSERDIRLPGPPDPTSADVRAARWEARAAGWDAATSDQRTGVEGFSGRDVVPATRPQSPVGAVGPQGPTDRRRAAEDTSPTQAAAAAEHHARESPDGPAGTVANPDPAEAGEDTKGSGD